MPSTWQNHVLLACQRPLGGATNHGTLMPWQVMFGPLTLATSHPPVLRVPSTVAVRPWPPTSTAVIWKVLACELKFPRRVPLPSCRPRRSCPTMHRLSRPRHANRGQGNRPVPWRKSIDAPLGHTLCGRHATGSSNRQHTGSDQFRRIHVRFSFICKPGWQGAARKDDGVHHTFVESGPACSIPLARSAIHFRREDAIFAVVDAWRLPRNSLCCRSGSDGLNICIHCIIAGGCSPQDTRSDSLDPHQSRQQERSREAVCETGCIAGGCRRVRGRSKRGGGIQGKAAPDPSALARVIGKRAPAAERIGFEPGAMTS